MTALSTSAARRAAFSAVSAISALAVLAAPAAAQSGARAGLFQKVAGSWSGGGTVTVSGGNPERIRCRADYAPTGAAQMRLALRCASDSFNLQVSSEISADGSRIAGRWSEAGSGASGEVSGTLGANQLQAVIDGTGLSARLALTVRGDTQTIGLSTQGQISASASMLLRRS